MRIIEMLWDAIKGDPPPTLPPALGPDMVSRREYEKVQNLYLDAVRDRREEKMRADCLAALLVQTGKETARTLTARVELYKKTLKARVRAS